MSNIVGLFILLAMVRFGLVSARPQNFWRRGLEQTNTRLSASHYLNDTVNALGGFDALDMVQGVTMQSSQIWRSQTLTQNYNLFDSDQSVAEAGFGNISFSFSDLNLQARIDRHYRYNDYWIWAFPNLEPEIDYSLVLQTGPNAFACFNKGQNSFFTDDPTKALGMADPYLTDYLTRQAQQYAVLALLQQFSANSNVLISTTEFEAASKNSYVKLNDPNFDLELLIDSRSNLPYAIRAYEDHAIFGPSTSDLVFSNYTSVRLDDANSIMFPHRMQIVYNSVYVLDDIVIDSVTLNPIFPDHFFTPTISSAAMSSESLASSPTMPTKAADYPISEVHEYFEAGLWGGPFGEMFNTSSLVIKPVHNTTPQIMNLYVGYPDYVQLLIEFNDGILVTDAPAHRSKIILSYIEENMPGKHVKWIVPSHHHRDHAGGVADYLAAGATLVVPEIAHEFYAHANNGNFSVQTYTQDRPFHLDDGIVQFSSFWHDENPHARDWTYALAGPSTTAFCPTANQTILQSKANDFVIFNADVISPGSNDEPAARWDVGDARQWLLQAVIDGVPTNATLVGAHGSSGIGLGTEDSLAHIAELTGFNYPEVGIEKWIGQCS